MQIIIRLALLANERIGLLHVVELDLQLSRITIIQLNYFEYPIVGIDLLNKFKTFVKY